MLDEKYLELCKQFAERSHHAKLVFDTSDIQLLDKENDKFDDTVPLSFHYNWITGIRSDSELMWAVDEELMYVSNGKIISKDNAETYTCYEKKCKSRANLKPNGIAYKVHELNTLLIMAQCIRNTSSYCVGMICGNNAN